MTENDRYSAGKRKRSFSAARNGELVTHPIDADRAGNPSSTAGLPNQASLVDGSASGLATTEATQFDRPYFKGCCRHAAPVHDQHGCTVDISTDPRCYWRCHDVDEKALDPRWRDYHTLPDEWLVRRVTRWFYRRKRVLPDDTVRYPFRLKWLVILLSRYSLRHFHCHLDGQCIFRAKHRGSCSWGADDDD